MEVTEELIRSLIELSSTGLEGLEHIKEQFQAGKYAETINLMTDVMAAILSMERVIVALPQGLLLPANISMLENIKQSLDKIVACYEQDDWKQLENQLEQFILRYRFWQTALNQDLSPYLLS